MRFHRPDGATSGLLCFRRTLRGPSYRGGGTFANPLSGVNVPCPMMGIQAPIPVSQMMESRSIMRLPHPAAIAGILTLSFGIPSVSAMQAPATAATAGPYTYADIADLATEAPIALHARIREATVLKPERAPGVAAGHVRIYVEADVVSLIRGSGPLAARISYLVDLPVDAKGKPPKLKKKQPVLLFARPVAGASAGTNNTGSVRLIAPTRSSRGTRRPRRNYARSSPSWSSRARRRRSPASPTAFTSRARFPAKARRNCS